MLNLGFKSLAGILSEPWRRAQHWLAGLGAERRCALRLDALADRLLKMGARIEGLRTLIEAANGEANDGDGSLRAALAGLKEDIRHVRCQLVAMRHDATGARLLRAFERLGRIAEDTYRAADQLQWQVDEIEAARRTPPRR